MIFKCYPTLGIIQLFQVQCVMGTTRIYLTKLLTKDEDRNFSMGRDFQMFMGEQKIEGGRGRGGVVMFKGHK